MSSESILGSLVSEKRWVMEMEKNFPQQHTAAAAADIDLDTPCCVFRVRKSVSETNPEAYAPRKIGLGPYHHLRPELYTITQRQKLAAVRQFINQENLSKVHEVVEALLERDAVARACYDQYIDLDAKTLSWILAIDGLYLLCYLSDRVQMEDLVGDVFMLENQIPILVLKTLGSVLAHHDQQLSQDFYFFCAANSPLNVMGQSQKTEDLSLSHSHLLHHMYHLIVSYRGVKKNQNLKRKAAKKKRAQGESTSSAAASAIDIEKGLRFLGEQGVPGAEIAGKVVSFMEKVPREKILALFNRGDEQLPLVDEIDIPTVSQMTEIAGITFCPTPGGIRDALFNEEEKRFYLPIITFKTHSDIVLRNLVAYEAASARPGATLELAEYVDLMCGIIDTNKDVEILKKTGIVRGDGLSDAQIVLVCNGIRRSTADSGKASSNIEQAIQNVNRRYDDVWSVKVSRSLNNWFSVSWKIVCAAVAVAVVVVLTVQAFCTVFGCSRWFGTTVQGFRFLYNYAAV